VEELDGVQQVDLLEDEDRDAPSDRG